MEEAFNRQLQATPRVDIADYRFSADNEDIGLKGYMQLKPGATVSNAQDASQIWQYLDSELRFQLSPKMVKSLGFNVAQMSPQKMSQEQINQVVDMQLGQYQQLGFLKPEGDVFISDVKIADDVLSVNGKPIMQISQMMAAAMAAQQPQATAPAPAVSE